MRLYLGLEETEVMVEKAKPERFRGGWYVSFAVRKVRKGMVIGVSQVFTTIIPTVSRIDAEYRARLEAESKNLKVWALLDSRPAVEGDVL